MSADPPDRPPLPPRPVLDAGGGVLLRQHRADDAEAVFEQCSDPEMQRWTTVPVPYERHHVEGFFAHLAQGWDDGTLAGFAVEADGRFAGTVDLRLGEPGGPRSASGSTRGPAAAAS